MNISVLGAGAWGTVLARMLHLDGHAVTLWGHSPGHLLELKTAQENKRYLPGFPLPSSLALEPSLSAATLEARAIIIAAPSKAFRGIASTLAGFAGTIISVTKGIERDTGLTMSGILKENSPHASIVALSGPSLAQEVARGIPTALVAASAEPPALLLTQQLLHRPALRVYSSSDVTGVELGGALKNVIAIAAGVGDGLGFGDNSKAALLTRGIAEIRRLGVACGALPETFSGLSGLGDLAVTCFSPLSRNRRLGERLGRGESLEQILSSTETVAEGYPTAWSARQLAERLDIVTPIIQEVHAVLYERKPPSQALQDLINRQPRAES